MIASLIQWWRLGVPVYRYRTHKASSGYLFKNYWSDIEGKL
jgi:hypothetical protein